MQERRDDTTETEAEPSRPPGAYYYDDATGYEVFDPEEEKDEEGEGGHAPAGGRA